MIINVNLIRAFEGPRHERLERIWKAIEVIHADRVRLRVFENPGARLSHASCLDKMWREELERTERYAIFTEFDFLPARGWLSTSHDAPVVATRYCTRSPHTHKLELHPYAGAWFVLVDKRRLRERIDRGELAELRPFDVSGPHNDPANGLVKKFLDKDVKVDILELLDCMPRHYGVEVVGKGEHCFWARHYNDPPEFRPAGFCIGDIQRKVDRVITEYESRLVK